MSVKTSRSGFQRKMEPVFFPGLWAPCAGRPHFSLLKVEGVFEAVPPDGRVKIFAGILGGTGAKAVQAQGVLIVVPISAVLSAGVQLAEHQLPVVFLLLLIPVHRTAPSLVLHLDGLVQEPGDGDQTAVALPGLIDGIGHDLKDRVLTALQPVGSEDHPGRFRTRSAPFRAEMDSLP